MSVHVGLPQTSAYAGLLAGLPARMSVAETVTVVLVVLSGLAFLALAGAWLVLRRSNRRRGRDSSG